ncbi:MAG TPA: DCC1-like thiol-disulfide oxidoreductase family protein [Chthonomonadaceae bacterium]|nr:DCC1-like thiol-disulfide oxidoreductase family protein [Chthonomonadaceae bacterium]
MAAGPVMLFDGKCNFCNGAVHFVVDHEWAPEFQFAPLQSDVTMELLTAALGDAAAAAQLIRDAEGSDRPTVIVLDGGKVLLHSSAVLRIIRTLRAPWSWGVIGWLIPRPIRDMLYIWFARNRIRLFGKAEKCRIPTPALRARFIGTARDAG